MGDGKREGEGRESGEIHSPIKTITKKKMRNRKFKD